MNSKKLLPKIVFCTLFIFFSIWFVLVLRSASLIWIHNTGFIGYDRWSPFIRSVRNNFFIATVQTGVIFPGVIIFLLKSNVNNLCRIVIAMLPLYILNLFIEPIGIWTMYYDWGAAINIGSVILFPLSVYLVLLFFSLTHTSVNTDFQHPVSS